MKKTIRISLLLSLLFLAACGKKEFVVEFSLPQDVDANYKLTYYASDKRGGIMMESAVAITAGKGEFKGQTINPTLIYLQAGARNQPLAVYVERGETVKISGADRDPATWKVEGNEINEEWSAWRNANARILSGGDPVEINRAVAAYVAAHESSPLSALLLLTTYSRADDETGFRRMWLSLKDDAASEKWASLAGRADQPSRLAPTPGRLKEMVMRSMQNGVDTIRPDSVAATILVFWNGGDDRRSELMDSVKALAKEFSDSSKRVIADVCLDSDSIGWRMQTRRDTLKGVARLWTPAGLADTRLMTLGVGRAPFFIVFSPDGHQRYRGADTAEAFSAFRSLMK